MPVGSSRKYQSQAVGLVQDMIEWLIDKRMVDYDDESEWRRRSGLEPLPPLPKSRSKPAGAFGGSAGVRPPPRGVFSAGGGGGGAADVINLLSDSMEDDDDEEDDDSFSEDEDF